MGQEDNKPDFSELGVTPFGGVDQKDRKEIHEKTVKKLVYQHTDIGNLPVTATTGKQAIIDTVCWTLAISDSYDLSTRRVEAQQRVADEQETSFQAVQSAVRRMYDGKYGRKSAQDLFDEDITDIEIEYQMRVNNR